MAVEVQSHNQLGDVRTDVLSDARLDCYKARDAFYACLEKESSKKPTEIATVGLLYPAECKKTRAAYEKQCRSSWVKHFDRDYCAKKKVKRFLDDPNAKRGTKSLAMSILYKGKKRIWKSILLLTKERRP
ncbi:hypothetical protein QQ045_002003 [Rhodiola kirilowii]